MADIYRDVRTGGVTEHSWVAWRAARDSLFRSHPQTPLEQGARESFRALAFFRYDPDLRFGVRLRPVGGETLVVAAGADGEVGLQPFAETDGLAQPLGQELTLFWVLGYGGGVLLPFTDATSGHETYGGGRYVLDTIKGADLGADASGRAVLDFNFAYNPSCSYSHRYVCPLAPPGNRLPAAIRAGEMHPSHSSA